MTDIDYDALGIIADDSYCNPDHTIADCARAVVAAYVAQQRARGVVEVDQHDLAVMGDWYQRMVTWSKADKDVYERVCDGKEDRF